MYCEWGGGVCGKINTLGNEKEAVCIVSGEEVYVGRSTRLPGMPERTQNEKGHSPASGAHANVATQDVSHILAMQQNAPLPLLIPLFLLRLVSLIWASLT